MQNRRTILVEVRGIQIVDVIQIVVFVARLVVFSGERGSGRLCRVVVGETFRPGQPVRSEKRAVAGKQLDLEHGGLDTLDVGEAHGPVPARVSPQAVLEPQRDDAVGLDPVIGGRADRRARRDFTQRGEGEIV